VKNRTNKKAPFHILVRDRRAGRQRPHYIHNRRDVHRAIRSLYRILFIFILATISLAAWLVALHIHPRHGAPLLFAWSIVLFTMLLIKPLISLKQKSPQGSITG
jgi:hypothetical protein